MAARRPLVVNPSGNPGQIATGDTIDPAYLPTSSSSGVPTRVPAGTTYTVPVDSQVLFKRIIRIEAGAVLKISANAVLASTQ